MNRAQYQKIYRKIAAVSPPAKIYIYGDAQLLKDGLIQGVKKTVAGFEEFNLNVFWMNELRSADGIKEIFDAIIAFPMMTDRRVVILRNFTFSRPIEKKFVESLEDFDFPNSTILLIEADELKKNIKAGKIIASQFETIELSTPSDKDLLDWVAYFCTRAGKKIQRGAAVELINLSGATLSALRQEIYKLANFVEGDTITLADVRQSAAHTRTAHLFEFSNAFGALDFQRALKIALELVEYGENYSVIFSWMFRSLSDMMWALTDPAGLRARLGRRAFLAPRITAAARGLSPQKILAAVEKLHRIDMMVKSGALESSDSKGPVVLALAEIPQILSQSRRRAKIS